jgi:alkylation response protein AidB-like acyl-CoA dehydrogenase
MLEFTEEQRLIRSEIRNLCSEFDDEYWRARDREKEYPMEFVRTLGEHTESVLREVGLGDEAIRRLHEAGVVSAAPSE